MPNPTLTRQQIVDEARTWLGTPIIHQARLKGVGVDCVGLLSSVFRALGVEVTDQTNYPRIPDGQTLITMLRANSLDEIEPDQAGPGDILVFKGRKDRPQHVAVKTEKGIIHASYTVRKVAEHRMNYKWTKKLSTAFRYQGLA